MSDAVASAGLLTVKEACEYLKVSRTTLYRWAALRAIKPVRRGGYVRYRRSELDRFLDQHSRGR